MLKNFLEKRPHSALLPLHAELPSRDSQDGEGGSEQKARQTHDLFC